MDKSYQVKSMFYDMNFVAEIVEGHESICHLNACFGLPTPIEVITDWPQSECVRPLDIFISVMWVK